MLAPGGLIDIITALPGEEDQQVQPITNTPQKHVSKQTFEVCA